MSVRLRFTFALCREVQDTYHTKGKDAAFDVVQRKAFPGDVSIDALSCWQIVYTIASSHIPQGNGTMTIEIG